MKTTDFAFFLNRFFIEYLPSEKGNSPLTIDSYRYCFVHLLTFFNTVKNIRADDIEIKDFTYANIAEFLLWLETTMNNSISTRNQRQAAINSFVKYLMYEFPEYLTEYQKILCIPAKKCIQREISFLKTNGVELFIKQIDLNKANGLRDYVMISLMYTTGIRVSELINIKVSDVSLDNPSMILVHGKGNKSRYVPLMKPTLKYLKQYISKYHLDTPLKKSDYLFKNHMHAQFTRQGINYIISTYRDKAREINPDIIPEDFSPHKMRHTAAMELLDAGTDLIYIRDLLGHTSVTTTEVYAKTNAKLSRMAIEKASKEIVPAEEAQWDNDVGLKEWLKSFNKRN